MSSALAALESVIDAVDAIVAPPAGSLSHAESVAWLQRVEALGRRADVLRVHAAGDMAERARRELGSESLARQHGEKSAGALIEKFALVSSVESARRIRLSRDIAPRVSLVGEVLPARFDAVASAFHAGDLGMDAALAIVRNLGAAERRASIEQLESGEQWLVTEAQTLCADLVAVQARAWRGALDPDGAEPRDRELRDRRRFVIGREVDGMTPFWGDADPVWAAQLRSALATRTAPDAQPRFLEVDDPAFDNADPALADPRTRDQRNFDVVMGLLLAGIRSDPTSATPRHGSASVMVVVQEPVLDRGVGTAWISDVAEPISAASAAVLACDSGVQKIYLGAKGEPLALGRRERYHSAAQRKALVVRDGGGCAWHRCTAPPSWTHAHHVIPWSQDGPTDVDNGVLLCPYHHRLVHEGEFEIQMFGGLPHLRAPMRLDLTQQWRRMGHERIAVAA